MWWSCSGDAIREQQFVCQSSGPDPGSQGKAALSPAVVAFVCSYVGGSGDVCDDREVVIMQ